MKKFRDFTLTDSTKKTFTTKQTSVLCTISGGQDSILTFFLFLHFQPKESLNFLYCHHFWQLKNFFSARLLFQLSYLVKVSYTLTLPQNFYSTENESRDWRRKNFYRVSQLEHLFTSLTGHTETDTLEKNLNNLFRGTSPGGVSPQSFLISQNKVNLFFSSIILNRCFFRLKTIKNFYHDVRKKKDSISVTTASYNFIDQDSSKSKKAKNFKFFKRKDNFFNNFRLSAGERERGDFKISLGNPSTRKTVFLWNKLLKSTDKKNKNTSLISRIKKKPYVSQLKSTTSFSFCFSNRFSNFQIMLEKPLKKTTRFTVSKLVSFYKFPNLIDVTNFSSSFSRNKIRHQLIPFLRSLFHPKVEYLVTHFFQMLNEESIESGKELQELYFIFQVVNSKSRKKLVFFITHASPLSAVGIRMFFMPSVPEIILKQSTELSDPYSRVVSVWSHKLMKENIYLIKGSLFVVSEAQASSLSQKLFYDYKNLTLNYSQNLKLQNYF